MSYSDRQKQVIWTSPSGKKFILDTDGKIKFSRKRKGEVKNNPTRSYGKKNNRTSYKTVNMSDDTFQDMGVSGRDFSLKIYFFGDNHDIDANNFEAAYCEHGKSKLQLPYGNIMTVQALDIDIEQDTVERTSLTEVNLSFHQCGGTFYPVAKATKSTALKKNISQMQETLSESFSDAVGTISDAQSFASRWSDNLDKIANKFSDIQNSDFIGILEDIKSQNILNNPLVMSTQIGILLKKGFSAYDTVTDVISSISDLITDFLPSSSGNVSKSEYTADDLFLKSTIISGCDAVNDSSFELRKDAINAAEDIQDINDNYIEQSQEVEQIINENLEDTVITEIDTTEIVNQTIGSIIDKIDDLKVEKTVCLKEHSNPLMIAFEYYPDMFKSDPDEAIEYVNKTNNFEGDDFFFLEKGRKIVIYV